jgi:hypothetical protein
MRAFWTAEEDQIVLEYYGKIPFKQISRFLPGRSRSAVKGRARHLGIKGDVATVMPLAVRKYTLNEHYFSVPTPENSYWAGFIAADGCISPERRSVKITLAEIDAEHLAKFARCIDYNGPITAHTGGGFKPQNPCVTLNICGASRWISDLGKNFSIGPRKTFTAQPPVGLIETCRLAFIIGYLDGDGSIYLAGHTHKNTTYRRIGMNFRDTREMLRWIQTCFDQLAPPDTKTASVLDHKVFPLYTIIGRRAEALLHKLHSIDVPRLERKWAQWETFSSGK